MPTVGWTFYGVATDPEPDDGIGLENFGYAPGQHVTASLTLTGAAASAYLASKASPGAGGRFSTIVYPPSGVDFFFPQPGQFDYDESEITTSMRLVGKVGSPVLLDAGFQTSAGSDFANGYFGAPAFGGAFFQDDNDARVNVEGVWIENGVTPKTLYGTGGNNSLKGTGQLNLIWGLAGNDKIELSSGQGYAWGGLGDDTFKGRDKDDHFWGGDGDDLALGNGGADRFFGQRGADELRGEEGNDLLAGGAGEDLLKGGSGDDMILGGQGADQLFGNDGRDVLLSGVAHFEAEVLYDRLDGGSGKDLLWGMEYAYVHGGPGDDQFIYAPVLAALESGQTLLAPADVIVTDFDPDDELIWLVVNSAYVTEGPTVASFATLMTYAAQVGDNVVFDFGEGGRLTLEDVDLGELSSDNFVFAFPDVSDIDPLGLLPSPGYDFIL